MFLVFFFYLFNNLNASKRIEELKDELDLAMASSGLIRNHIPGLRNDLANAYRNEEIYWKTKSRNTWLKVGDRNTKFFHPCTKSRFSKNRIHSIQDSVGNSYKGDRNIGTHAEVFFRTIYKSNNTPIIESIFDDFTPTVTPSINNAITKDFSHEEIYEAVCSIGADRAPGPDGLTVRFYQEYWDIIGDDVIQEVKSFF